MSGRGKDDRQAFADRTELLKCGGQIFQPIEKLTDFAEKRGHMDHLLSVYAKIITTDVGRVKRYHNILCNCTIRIKGGTVVDYQNDRTELAHYGILGMKWGVRRYQNPDGSLTPAGRARYNTGDIRSKNTTVHEDHKKVHDGKRANELSDAELRERLNRLNMERQYVQLTDAEYHKGKTAVTQILKTATTVATATGTAVTLYNNSDKLIKIGKTTFDAVMKLMGEDD